MQGNFKNFKLVTTIDIYSFNSYQWLKQYFCRIYLSKKLLPTTESYYFNLINKTIASELCALLCPSDTFNIWIRFRCNLVCSAVELMLILLFWTYTKYGSMRHYKNLSNHVIYVETCTYYTLIIWHMIKVLLYANSPEV